MTIIPKIKCPRCNPSKLYKFSKNPYGYQKYQCRNYRRQFSTKPKSNSKCNSKYLRCPKCGKAHLIYHDYKHFTYDIFAFSLEIHILNATRILIQPLDHKRTTTCISQTYILLVWSYTSDVRKMFLPYGFLIITSSIIKYPDSAVYDCIA